MRSLDGFRCKRRFFEIVIRAGKRTALLGKQKRQHLDRFAELLRSAASRGKWNAVRLMLSLIPPCAEAENESSITYMIDGCSHFGEQRRIAVGIAGDQRSDAYLFRLCG